jgi:glutaredoxin
MGLQKLNYVEQNGLTPVCPYCEAELHEIYTKTKGFPILVGKSILLFCPHCRKVLGFGQSRMA